MNLDGEIIIRGENLICRVCFEAVNGFVRRRRRTEHFMRHRFMKAPIEQFKG